MWVRKVWISFIAMEADQEAKREGKKTPANFSSYKEERRLN